MRDLAADMEFAAIEAADQSWAGSARVFAAERAIRAGEIRESVGVEMQEEES